MIQNASQNKIIQQVENLGAHNYHPLPLVLTQGEGAWVWDSDGKKYLDMLSAYSALNHGHRHPKLIQALKTQADRITLTSRAFHNDQLGVLYEKITSLTGKSRALPMNTGVEAVETAIKAARRWGYRHKKIPLNQAEIIVCEDNFHGRTLTAVSLSSNEEYKADFGPFTPGFKVIPFGDIRALQSGITKNTAAFLVEPIQGEAGIIIPPEGYLKSARKICQENRVLFIADEIQTGFGRTGKTFACHWEGVDPDIYILGKALGGGVLPISAIAANDEIMNVFEPGSHGSTFGGNPLACAVAIAALEVLVQENLTEKSQSLGSYLIDQLREIQKQSKNSPIREIRGRGLFIGVELSQAARPYCERLMRLGVLCKETHETTVRLAPPLVSTKSDLDFALSHLKEVFKN